MTREARSWAENGSEGVLRAATSILTDFDVLTLSDDTIKGLYKLCCCTVSGHKEAVMIVLAMFEICDLFPG